MEELSIVPDSPPPSVPAVSVPAVPPTPPVPLSALLAREDLALRLIAGPAGPDTVIHWAHTSEMADPYPYLLGGELLLTAGVHVPAAAGPGEDAPGPEDYFDGYVSRIVAAGGAALGFGLAPVHDTVPPALVAACDTYGLPLLEVLPRTTFSGVARARVAAHGPGPAGRAAPGDGGPAESGGRRRPPGSGAAVLRQPARRVNGWAVLYGPEGTELARAGTVPPPRPPEAPRPGPAAPAPHPPPGNPAPPENLAPPGNPTASARPAPTDPQGPENPAAPGSPSAQAGPPTPDSLATPDSPTTPADPAARVGPLRGESPEDVLGELAGVVRPRKTQGPAPASATDTVGGVHLTAYALGSGQGFVLGVASPRRDPGDHTIASGASVLLSPLTGGQQGASGAARSAALVRLLLGAAPEAVGPLLGGDRWVVVHARPAGDGPAPDAVSASALAAALGSALVDVGGDVVRVLVPGDRVPAAQPGWTCGISAPASPHGWAAADTQAARALARARATRAALVRHGDRPALADLVTPADAEDHAGALLAPVAGTPALTETLRTWLSLHGSWDRTAVALSVHRNTVRQRIARCAALLDTDLDDPDVRMELWFALREDGTRGAPNGPTARTPE
ncbi:helix-turn-helix domain-containing protein [Streptomyces sp. LN245]|uniref:helix-turn-helix domain-containing protein n=1 Tax=Streptomyces sp. LN245 TaxID=3112975 RepID=UPI003711D533